MKKVSKDRQEILNKLRFLILNRRQAQHRVDNLIVIDSIESYPVNHGFKSPKSRKRQLKSRKKHEILGDKYWERGQECESNREKHIEKNQIKEAEVERENAVSWYGLAIKEFEKACRSLSGASDPLEDNIETLEYKLNKSSDNMILNQILALLPAWLNEADIIQSDKEKAEITNREIICNI